MHGKKAAIAREWGLCLLEGGKFAAPGDAGVYEGVRKNVDYHIQQRLGKVPLLAPPGGAAPTEGKGPWTVSISRDPVSSGRCPNVSRQSHTQ